MKTILATAYSINPYKGSEDAMGWNYALQIARYNKVIIITRENNKGPIKKYLDENNIGVKNNLQFVYYDLPYWMRFWKKGGNGVILYYYLWQLFLPYYIKKRRLDFNIVHNLNFHNDWAPSFLWRFEKPFVWGPVGHHPKIPKQFILPIYGFKSYIQDRFTWIIKNAFWKFDPFLKISRKKATTIWAMHSDSAQKFKKNKNIIIAPSIAATDMATTKTNKYKTTFNVLSVGRFVPLKGFDVTINSFNDFLKQLAIEEKEKTKLTLVGTGPLKKQLQNLIIELGIQQHVEIIEWMDREELKKLYNSASVFLFPSHEGAGMVVAEALSCSLPVLCFNNCGPGTFINETCGIKVNYSNYKNTSETFGNSLFKIFNDKSLLENLSLGARAQFENVFEWKHKGEILKNIYEKAI